MEIMAGAEIERQSLEMMAATPRTHLATDADATETREKLEAILRKVQFFPSRKTIRTNAEAGRIVSQSCTADKRPCVKAKLQCEKDQDSSHPR